MKNLIKRLRSGNSGFTLIELLVVIVIIGILAVAVLAAIDPIEQIRRGRDTACQVAAREFLSAAERYYGVYEDYPWTGDPSSQNITSANWDGALVQGDELQAAKELKAGFEDRSPIANSKLWLTEDGNENVHMCFDPESKAFGDKASLGSAGTGSGNYFCVPDSGD